MARLKNKVAVIAGAGSGIGRAAAILFADEGAKVALIARKKEIGEETVEQIRARGSRAVFIQADLLKSEKIEKAFEKIETDFGKIDVLFCNAGAYAASSVKEMLESSWDEMFDSNLKSYFLSVRAAIPYFVKNQSGSIVLTGAIFGYSANTKNMAHYNSSKAGVVAFTKSLALELAPQGIRVNCICPGQISHQLYSGGKPVVSTDAKLLRAGLPEDAAFAALYFASDESAWVTGTTLVVDGGMSVGVALPKAVI